MQLIDRVQSIVLRPKETWPVIAAEPADTASIYSRYLVILAAIPALAKAIGLAALGFGPVVIVLQLVFGYVLSLVMIFVLALIIDALAPTFGGTKSPIQALKLAAYGCTAGFLGGVFTILPILSILSLVGVAYSIYLIYLGIPVLMRAPFDKAGAYTAVVIVCGLVAGIVLSVVLGLVTGGAMFGAGMARGVAGGPGNVTVGTADGTSVTVNAAGIAEMAKRMEDAGKRVQAAQAAGDHQAAGKAMGDVMAAMSGGSSKPIAAADLKALLPEAVAGLRRNSVEASGGQAMGIAGSSAKAAYADGDKTMSLSITDTGGLAGLAGMAGAWANVTVDKEADGLVEKVYKEAGRTVHEQYRKDGSRSEYSVILGNGVIVEAEGDRIGMDTLKTALASIDVGKIEAAKRAAK